MDTIDLTPDWFPLSEADSAPDSHGLYALGAPVAVDYGLGASHIVYIGSTVNLQKRLKRHRGTAHNWHLSELRRVHRELWGAYWPLPVMERMQLQSFEGEAICAFERAFGRHPFCNLDVPIVTNAERYRGLVSVPSCPDESSIPMSELAASLQWVELRRRETVNETFYRPPMTPEELAELEKMFRRRDERREMEHLTWITSDNVAAWSVLKMRRLLNLAESLQPLESETSVIRFESETRKVPRPDTWGEVALVKARLVAGTWNPAERLWLRVVHQKEVLGDAKLERLSFHGVDCSDRPQRKRPRTRSSVARTEERAERILQKAIASRLTS